MDLLVDLSDSITNNKVSRKLYLVRCLLSCELLKKSVCSSDTFCFYILVDGGESRSVELTQHIVIKAHNGNLVGNTYASVCQSAYKSYCIEVRYTEDSGKLF